MDGGGGHQIGRSSSSLPRRVVRVINRHLAEGATQEQNTALVEAIVSSPGSHVIATVGDGSGRLPFTPGGGGGRIAHCTVSRRGRGVVMYLTQRAL